jgi:hypothetical protein
VIAIDLNPKGISWLWLVYVVSKLFWKDSYQRSFGGISPKNAISALLMFVY